ncbi:MAG: hypothetical protein ABIO05_03715, partial [Ferruginibacter sp.]
MGNKFIFLLLAFVIPLYFFGQTNKYAGTWSGTFKTTDQAATLQMQLFIAEPDNELFYPAHLTLQSDTIRLNYDLLLAKKSFNQLGISWYKQAGAQTNSAFNFWMTFVNNVFQYTKDNKKGILLTLQRLPAPKLLQSAGNDTAFTTNPLALLVKDFLLYAPITLSKTIGQPTMQADRSITNVLHDGRYFGIQDTFHVSTDTVNINIPYNKKNDDDTVSLTYNGGYLIQETGLRKKITLPIVELQKGENVFIFFADNFGSSEPSGGKTFLQAGKRNIVLDFSTAQNQYATFIAVKLFYDPPKSDTIIKPILDLYNIKETTPIATIFKPGDSLLAALKLKRATFVRGKMTTTSRQITLALWDDAIEDGDSITLFINGKL